jgi:hypothetical protein
MKSTYIFLLLLLFSNTAFAAPDWSNDIAKIIYGNCSSCHHPGGIGPFSLMNYQDGFDNAYDIGIAVSAHTMPPWSPDPDYKHFAHERVLSPSDVQAIQQWVAAGAPSGDLRFAPSAPTFNSNSQLGTADLSLRIPSYTVSSSNDVYINFVLPSGLSQSEFINAMEVIPGNTEIVHHVLVFQDSTNNPISISSSGGTGSNASKLIFAYTPGAQPYWTPDGTGFRLAANTRIILQMHYAPGSNGKTDSTRVNFKFGSNSLREIQVGALLNHITTMTNGPLHIPANQTKTYYEELPVIGDWTFLYVFPHMHLIGKTITSYAVNNNDTIPFVNIPDWDFHWQDNFVFPNTVKVPDGSTLYASAFYDNTTNNPDNPSSPPHTVSSGESTLDEMMVVFFAYMPYESGDQDLIVDNRVIAMGATTFCEGQSVELRAIEGSGYTYRWYKNGNSISAATSSRYVASETGSYHVRITLGHNHINSDDVNIIVNTLPVADIISPATTIIPLGGNITLDATTGSGYSYQWYLNRFAISGATDSVFNATVAGDYSLEVYNGCYDTSTTVTLTQAPNIISVNTASNPAAGGTTAGNGNYLYGSSVTLSATPNTGYAFVSWTNNGNIVSTDSSYTFTIAGSSSLVANFSLLNYSITTSIVPSGAGFSTGGGSYSFGSGANVNATANPGYVFVNWTEGGNQVSASQSYSFNVTGARNLVAHFSALQFNITTSASPSNAGSTSGDGTYSYGSNIFVSASANSGYTFVNWTEAGNVVSVFSTYSFAMTGSRTLKANFVSNSQQFNVTTIANPAVAGVTSGDGTFSSGSVVTVTASANPGYAFMNWSENTTVVSLNPVYVFTLTSMQNLVANFSSLTGVADLNKKEGILIYPNPSTGIVNVYSEKESDLNIYDELGQRMLIVHLSDGNNAVEINAKGIYLFRVEDYFSRRVIIE